VGCSRVPQVTEIRIDVDFGHGPDLVWRTLTDRRLLSRWFMLTDLEPVQGSRFQLIPEALPGFDGPIDGDLTDLVPARRVGMRWRGEQLHARVTWALTPTPDGCRLTVTQSGFLGVRGTARRRELLSTYHHLFGVRLLAVLDALARGDEPVALPPPPPATGAAPRHGRRRQILAVAAAALLIALVGVLVSNLPSETSEPAAAGTTGAGSPVASHGPTSAPAATATRRPPGRWPSAPVTTPAPGRTAGPSTPAATGATLAAPAELSARYTTVSTALLGYRGEIAVENSGGTAAAGWTVTITVPPLAVVTGVEGPRPSQQGTTVTFSGGSVAVGASTRVVFDVGLNTQLGSAKPLSCKLDRTPCAGL
jgi:uncharacterized protein YndB with AHSA1/START domain